MTTTTQQPRPVKRIRFDTGGPKRPITLVQLPPYRTDLLED